MRIHRRSKSSRAGRSRVAPIGVSLISGLALVGGFTIASAVGVPSAGAAATPHFQEKAPNPVAPKGPTVLTDDSSHVNQTPPTLSSTPHVIAHSAIVQTFTVNTENDTNLATAGSTSCVDSDGNCSLRAAVQAANNDYPNVDAIDVPANYVILLDSANGAINVNNSMFISGDAGGAVPIIDGQGTTEDFSIYSNSTSFTPAVEMTNLTVQGGSSYEGADIYLGDDAADLTLSSVTVTGGSATYGAGIYVESGSALWTDAGTAITNNVATSEGGGIYSDSGSIVASGSTISGNSAPDGGGIYNDGALQLDAAQINSNTGTSGAAVLNAWSLVDNGSSYNDNMAGTSVSPVEGPEGAVLWNDNSAILTDVSVSGSQAWDSGSSDGVQGGVFFNAWQLSLNNVSVANTTNRSDGNEISGGVVGNFADQDEEEFNGTLSVNGLTVSGTSNGATGVDTDIYGGVVFNDYKASVSGLNVSSTTNSTGDSDLYGGVGDVEWTIDCCPTNYDGSTAYQNVNVSGTSNTGTDDAYHQGGVFDVDYDFVAGGDFPDGPGTTLSGDINGGTITGTTENIGSNEVDGAAVATASPMNMSNLTIDSTTVTTDGGEVFGGAVASLNDCYDINCSFPSMSASDVSVTNTNVTALGGGDGFVDGGAWYNSDQLTANDLQILGTAVTSDDVVVGGGLSDANVECCPENETSNITNSTFARTTVTMQGSDDGAVGALFLAFPAAVTNVTVDDNSTSSSAAANTVYVDSSDQFTNDTVANNTVSGAGDNSSIYTDDTANFKNTIVQTDGGPNCEVGEGSPVSDGGNLEAGGNTCNFNLPSDQNNVGNALVASVADNGGPVETAALQPSSPAIGKGVSAGCPTDRRSWRGAPGRQLRRRRLPALQAGVLDGGQRRRHLQLRQRRLLRLHGRHAAELADRRHGRDARRQGLLGGGGRRRHLQLR